MKYSPYYFMPQKKKQTKKKKKKEPWVKKSICVNQHSSTEVSGFTPV